MMVLLHRLNQMNTAIFSLVILTFTTTGVQLRTVGHREIIETFPSAASEKCRCEEYCPKGLKTFYTSCRYNHTVYYECQPSSCSIKYCPPNQVFTDRKEICEYCQEGYHLDKTGAFCTCNVETKLDRNFLSCVPCPAGSIFIDGYCHCPPDQLHDDQAHVCRNCPDDTTKREETCLCKNPTLFFSEMDFSCKECPGVLVENNYEESWYKYDCHCLRKNEIFTMWSASCVPCPPNSAPYHGQISGCRRLSL